MDIMAGVCLFLQSIWDVRTKTIPLWISLGFGVVSFFYSLCIQREWNSFLYAILPGVFCLGLGYCTRQAIGYGDGFLLCALATLYSLEEVMQIIIVAISIAAVIGLVLFIIFHKSGKYEIPFVPFLFLGWMFSRGIVIIEGLII